MRSLAGAGARSCSETRVQKSSVGGGPYLRKPGLNSLKSVHIVFLIGASLRLHLEVVSGAAETYALEVEGATKKETAKMRCATQFCNETHHLEKALHRQVFLPRGHSVEQVHSPFASGKAGIHN